MCFTFTDEIKTQMTTQKESIKTFSSGPDRDLREPAIGFFNKFKIIQKQSIK